ncbi:MAG: DUF86 domain-containing protein [Lachnospiraceae bacterium]|nr:DUF86 domain-containing protein [Lachnospiraceae bacterium]
MTKFQERDVDGLLRILDHCDRIDECVRRFGDSMDAFSNDADYRDAVKMNLFQIGETVNALSDECKEQIPGIVWHRIYGMRNIIAHRYEKIRDDLIWHTVKEDIPDLKLRIHTALEEAGIKAD